MPLAQRIARAMRGIDGVDVPVGTLDITLYRDDLSKVASQPVLHSSEIPFPVDDKDLILVDDVLYTGRTVRAAMNGLFDLGRPQPCAHVRADRPRPPRTAHRSQLRRAARPDQRHARSSKCA